MTHHLFHPYGTDSLQDKKEEDIMLEVTLDDSLQSQYNCPAPVPAGSRI